MVDRAIFVGKFITVEKGEDFMFIVGQRTGADSPEWWRGQRDCYLYVFCQQGSAELSIMSKPQVLKAGSLTVIAPDMFPWQKSASDDFLMTYCLFDSRLADQSVSDVPMEYFECVYAEPTLPSFEGFDVWRTMFENVSRDAENPYRKAILIDLLHAFTLIFIRQWRRHYGDGILGSESDNGLNQLCIRFYNLVFEHYRTHRDTAFYADQLCITQNYLSIILRKQCGESPKQAIDRQVMLDLEHQLRTSGKTIGELATEFHFTDQSAFCRYFRRLTGISLSDYRKQKLS